MVPKPTCPRCGSKNVKEYGAIHMCCQECETVWKAGPPARDACIKYSCEFLEVENCEYVCTCVKCLVRV